MSGISTHVLDTACGRPAVGVAVVFEAANGDGWRELARGTTESDGRIAAILPGGVPTEGEYRLRFATGDYFCRLKQDALYTEVIINVWLQPGTKYHLPLLLSPFGYSTYRGS
jgi:5-hydroxyisourate hydrolase